MPNSREPGELLKGQLFDRQEGVALPFTQQISNFNTGEFAAHLGTANYEIIPVDGNASQEKLFDISAAQTLRATLGYSFPVFIQMDLPDVLTNLTVYYNRSDGTGADSHTGTGASVGDSWSFGMNLPGRATSSISVIPDVIPVIERFEAGHTPALAYRFFFVGNPTETTLIAKLLSLFTVTALPFPKFKTETFTVLLFGQQISVSADVNAQQQASASDTNTTFTQNSGQGYSIQTGVSNGTKVIGPVLHGNITIPNASLSATIAATAAAGWTGTGAGAFNAVSNPFPTLGVTSTVPTQTAIASVKPSVLAATSPSAIPLFGLYLYDYHLEFYQTNEWLVTAFVVNMNVFGPSLSAMTISHGTLNPTFAPGTKNYTATSSDSSITLTPTYQEAGTTITVNGSTVTSGSASSAISLSVGENRIVVIATDAALRTTTYILLYTRT